tara:strand:- start:487 stop:1692 length:1206 start_codon:yes stop_codon:yes gene_type:complete
MKRSLAILLNFETLEHFLQVNHEILSFLSENLKEIYFINLPNNKFKTYKNSNKIKFLDRKNFKYLNPKNLNEFEEIIKNNNFLIKNNIGTGIKVFRILRILKIYSVPQINISNIGFLTDSLLTSKNEIVNSFLYFFKKVIIHRFYIFLAVINIMPKIDIRFVSSKLQKEYFENNKKKIINKFFFNQHFSIYKKLILVNSRSFDIFKKTKIKSNKKLIILLDIKADHETNLLLDRKIINKNKRLFYKNLNFFLKWCEKKLSSKIVICTHPYYNLSERKKIYKNFKVVQGQTKKYIQKCNSVFFFHSSAITEAFFLKKNIINLETKILGEHWEHSSNIYPKYAGLEKINIDSKSSYQNLNLKKIIKRKSSKYYNFRKNFLIPDGNNSGFKKIYNIIKSSYSVS